MKLTGEQKIHASRQTVWAGLNDVAVLQQCIPGCQSLEQLADDRMQAVVEVKVGPIGARFTGAVTISDQIPLESYTISGEGQGGTAGNAKGNARVRLVEDGQETVLVYDVEAQVGGRLAQLGGPIIDATAKQLAARFFRQFGEVLGQSAIAEAAKVEPAVDARPEPAGQDREANPVTANTRAGIPAVWLLTLLSSALIGFLIGRAQTDPGSGDWIGLPVGLLVVIVAAAAFAYGRLRSPAQSQGKGRA